MAITATDNNQQFVDFWADVLTPKWIRFRHLLSGNGKIHSDRAASSMAIERGARVLDVGCGFGENCLELSELVGDEGSVVGLDCTPAFLEIAESERATRGASNVRYQLDDIESCELRDNAFDVVFSRFGMMYNASPVRAMRNVHRALAPGGRFYFLVWRSLADNPCWAAAEQVALRHLSRPNDGASTCGPGPFSMADPDTVRLMLDAAKLCSAEFRQIDADICVGRSMEEAIDYQLLVGPAGFIIREAADRGRDAVAAICEDLTEQFRPHTRSDGSVWLPSSTWLISAAKGN